MSSLDTVILAHLRSTMVIPVFPRKSFCDSFLFTIKCTCKIWIHNYYTLFLPTSWSLSHGLPCSPDPLGGASGDGFSKKRKRPVRFCGPPRHPCHLVHLQLVEEPGTSPVGAVHAAGCCQQQ